MEKPRTLVAHEHRLFLAGLELLLAQDFEIIFTTTESGEVLDAVRRFRPALVVYGPAGGLDLTGEIHKSHPNCAVAVLSRFDDPTVASEALRRGAHAYILITSSETELLEGLHAAVSRRVFVTPRLMPRVIHLLAMPTHGLQGDVLTSRQLAVVTSIAAGKSMKETAAELHVATRTVAFHKYGIMRKLQISTTAELVQYAVKRGL